MAKLMCGVFLSDEMLDREMFDDAEYKAIAYEIAKAVKEAVQTATAQARDNNIRVSTLVNGGMTGMGDTEPAVIVEGKDVRVGLGGK